MKKVIITCVFVSLFLSILIQKAQAPHIEYVESNTPHRVQDPVRLIFVGDMMFDRYIRQKAEENGYEAILKGFKETFQNADFVVGNLEGPITSYNSISKYTRFGDNGHFSFTFDPYVAKILKEFNIHVLDLGNNHIQNFGMEGIEETRKYLNEENLSYFGDPHGAKSILYTVQDTTFAFISFNQFGQDSVEQTVHDINKTDADFVIVFAHWGNEYETIPNQFQVDAAHAFIDNGADLVIGAHPHVIQSKEYYKGKYIYYSLGNFVFDQYFQDDVLCGLVLHVEAKKDKELILRETFSKLEKNGTTVPSTCMSEVPVL